MSASELSDAAFGKKFCDVVGYSDCWVQFRTSGYPRKLRREWTDANPEQTWDIVMRYVIDWNLRDLDGHILALTEDTGNVEDAVYIWVIRAFAGFWLTELTAPRPNS